jgi:hypothetical protein
MNINLTISLLAQITSVFKSAPPHDFIVTEQSIEIHSEKLPYIFVIKCFNEVGWHVFMMPKSGELSHDLYSSKLYSELEKITDQINLKYFELETPHAELIYDSLLVIQSLLQDIFSKSSITLFSISRKEPGVIRIVACESEASYPIDVGYSRFMDRWYMDAPHILDESLKDGYSIIDKWNDPFAKLFEFSNY